jgi:putative aminopeptidase FrvX
MENIDFLEKYLNTQSPTGHETEGQKVWLDHIKPYVDETFTDIYGTAVAVINPGKNYKVVIEAHADEIGWTVSHIDDKGYISVVRNGGSDQQVAPSQRVNIIGDKGIVKGVFGWLAIHERKENPVKHEVKNLYIDIGADSKEEVLEMGVEVGCVLTYADGFDILNDKYFVGRALDNRVGGYMIAQVVKMLKENKIELPYSLYIVNAVQEEVGLKGAEMIAQTIKPDVAIITDVCHDSHSPLYDIKSVGDLKCGRGPVLFHGIDVQRNLLKMIKEVSKSKDISVQSGTNNGNSGTDTGAFYKANGGCASALISLPLKYMHTSVEVVSREDVTKVIELIYSTLIQLESGHDFRYIKN